MRIAKHDFAIFKELFDFDLKAFEKVYPSLDSRLITQYVNIDENSKLFNKRIRGQNLQSGSAAGGSGGC